jgi:hypothetical protein
MSERGQALTHLEFCLMGAGLVLLMTIIKGLFL